MPKQARAFLRRMKRRKFGELLLSQGAITPEQLDEALEIQRKDGGLLGEIMIHKGFISENEVVRSLSTQYGLPVLRIRDYDVDKELVGRFPVKLLYTNMILPLSELADLLLVTVADLPDDQTIRNVEEMVRREVVFYLSSATDIRTTLTKLAPISDDEAEQYASLRRRKSGMQLSGVAAKPGAGGGTTGESASGAGAQQSDESLFGELDNAWESIFDEAEQNLKRKEPG